MTEIDEVKKENESLREKLQKYKQLEEDLMSQRIFEKAKAQLSYWITAGGIVAIIATILGVGQLKDYAKKIADEKLHAISDQELLRLLDQKAEQQVTVLVSRQTATFQEIADRKISDVIALLPITGKVPSGGAASDLTVGSPKSSVDYTSMMLPAKNSGSEGSVVGLAVASAMEFQIKKKLGKTVPVSSRFLYYYSRIEAGVDPRVDTGANIKDAIKVLATRGVVPESLWPYVPGQYGSNPPAKVGSGEKFLITSSVPLKSLDQVKAAVQKYGPVVVGIPVYESFESTRVAKTGMVPIPAPNEQIIGGHAIVIVGYDDAKELLKFQNSWGSEWGDKGYGYLSYSFLKKYLSDGWAFTM